MAARVEFEVAPGEGSFERWRNALNLATNRPVQRSKIFAVTANPSCTLLKSRSKPRGFSM